MLRLILGEEYARYPVRRQSQPSAPAPQSQKNLREGKKRKDNIIVNTGEPPNKRHFGGNSFVPCREVVPISEVNNTKVYIAGGRNKCPL